MDELKDQNNSLSPQNKSIVFQPVIINDESILKLHFVESNSIEGFENGNDKINLPENSPINNTQSNKEIKTSVIRETDSPDNNGDSTIRNSILSNQNSMLLSPSVGGFVEEELKPIFKNRPNLLLRKSEELKQNNLAHIEGKDLGPKGSSLNKDGSTIAFSSTFPSNYQRTGLDGLQKGGKRGLLNKAVTFSLPFDEYLDRVSGTESIASNYPSYKIDKRLIFLGKEVDFPWHIISYHSRFRNIWNLFITIIIIYEVLWYPAAVTFIYAEVWPLGNLVFEIVSIFIFLLDIIINIRTTYSNENNEEIIDSKMMKDNYLKSKLFIIDVISVIPLPEILLLIMMGSSKKWIVYSLTILLRMLRACKVQKYTQHQTRGVIARLLKLFIIFFLLIHWVSCLWYVVINAESPDTLNTSHLWFPNNLRMVAANDVDLLAYYYKMSTFKVYGYTLLSVFMLAIGSDMAPVTDIQIWFSVVIALFGAVGLAYIFAMVTLIINAAYKESSAYQEQLEELKDKLRVNNIPHNLKVKVMEYFNYSWRKNRVLKKINDFSELSIPLQRDIALYQHQEMILKVPLFKDLDLVEILSIVQKLKTAIYMPGDKIIREGERGTEMFFIQEGIAEMFIRKPTLKRKSETPARPRYEKILLKKGNYFGEVSLMSNSKRTFDVTAFEFCIMYTFSKTDYDSLKTEFKDIGPRLRSGLKYYKNTQMASLIQILKNLDIFQGFNEQELQRIGDEYLEEVFVDPDSVILAPKARTNAIYIVLAGRVNCYADDDETKSYLSNIKRSKDKDNWTVLDLDEEQEIDCLDDDILKLEKDKLSMEDDKKKLDLLATYTYGEYFGTLDFDTNEIKCDKYYVTDSGCQIGAMTQTLKSQMAEEDPQLYDKLKTNILKISPKRAPMGLIEEESECSSMTRNNTLIKAKRHSIIEFGKKPVLIKIPSTTQNKDDDLAIVKDELQQLEEEMNHFKGLVSSINMKLNRVGPLPQSEDLTSPELYKTNSKALMQVRDHIRGFEKIPTSKELAKKLLGVVEADPSEEAVSIRKED